MNYPILIQGDFFDVDLAQHAPFQFAIVDPPYGEIVDEDWDKLSEGQVIQIYLNTMHRLARYCDEGSTAYAFGGIGKPRKKNKPATRPFFKVIPLIESETRWRMYNLITWSKKRAYGKPKDFLFTREEIAMFVLGDEDPKTFNVPYLDERRGYLGYDSDHPCKSDFKRRTNVWSDVTEVLRGKVHRCQKPEKLYEIMVETSSNPGDHVLDPFAGSGTLGRVCPDRVRVMVERKVVV